jgi:hypothetical protein
MEDENGSGDSTLTPSGFLGNPNSPSGVRYA